MTLTDLETELLRTLDAAPYDEVPDRARLDRLLAEPVPPRRHRGRRLAAVGAVAAGAVVAVPLVGLPGDAAAFETWTPTPTALSAGDRSAADDGCRDRGLDVSDPEVRLAERRGDWVVLMYAGHRGSDPVVAGCLVLVPPGSAEADDTDLAWIGGQGLVPEPAGFTDGGLMQFGGDRWLGADRPDVTVVQGDVGADVTGLTFVLGDGRRVAATVGDGHYVAWWPGHELDYEVVTATR